MGLRGTRQRRRYVNMTAVLAGAVFGPQLVPKTKYEHSLDEPRKEGTSTTETGRFGHGMFVPAVAPKFALVAEVELAYDLRED